VSATAITEILPGVYRIELGFVSVALVDLDGSLTLIDAGFPGDGADIAEAITALGYQLDRLERIVLTHGHLDHVGAAADLRLRTGAEIHLSEVDALRVREGWVGHGEMHVLEGFEDLVASQLADPDFRRRSGDRDTSGPVEIEPFEVDRLLAAESGVPGWPDTSLIPAPGHCRGQLAILWRQHGGVLFAGDSAVNFGRPMIAPVAEDFDLARESYARVAAADFDVAVFGHGEAIVGDAASAFGEDGR
jgi:glyoxylase-like metal-dependent hydrolase (beta-lactamase superfamily II)